jgi:hypothetical protein
VTRFVKAVTLFTLLTVVMTWPQVTRLATDADGHPDVFFNMWRFAWVAHALSTAPSHFFDGNIFYPEPRTLTFSDAMPVEALVAAPLLWSGTPPVLVHNLMLLAGIVLSAAGIFMLARHLTGSGAAGITAGIVFAFAPYRFDHYMHMELQWTVWIPWAFWALHRTVETGSRRYAGMMGAFVALQFMSSIYYGVFLTTLVALCALLLLSGTREPGPKRGISLLAIAAATAAILTAPYAIPYAQTKHHLGGRSEQEVLRYSARPSSYLVATDTNYLYGQRSAPRGRPERRLFPGVLPLLLAVTGLLLRRPSNEAVVYLLGLVAAFELSLGFYGHTFSVLYHYAPIFDGLRAPARLGIFVMFFLAMLAANGHATLEAAIPRRARLALLAGISLVLLLEYWVAPLRLVPFPNDPPPLYAWLAKQPRGVVAEYPMPGEDTLPGLEPRYNYMSTFHWMPTINGYSGYYPPSYARLDPMKKIPDPSAVEALVQEGVVYVIVHPDLYEAGRRDHILTDMAASPRFAELGRFDDGLGTAAVFRVRR